MHAPAGGLAIHACCPCSFLLLWPALLGAGKYQAIRIKRWWRNHHSEVQQLQQQEQQPEPRQVEQLDQQQSEQLERPEQLGQRQAERLQQRQVGRLEQRQRQPLAALEKGGKRGAAAVGGVGNAAARRKLAASGMQ